MNPKKDPKSKVYKIQDDKKTEFIADSSETYEDKYWVIKSDENGKICYLYYKILNVH